MSWGYKLIFEKILLQFAPLNILFLFILMRFQKNHLETIIRTVHDIINASIWKGVKHSNAHFFVISVISRICLNKKKKQLRSSRMKISQN